MLDLIPEAILETASTAVFMGLTAFVILVFFAVIPGFVIIVAGILMGLVVSVPILAVASLIFLVPRPAVGSRPPKPLEPGAPPEPQPEARFRRMTSRAGETYGTGSV